MRLPFTTSFRLARAACIGKSSRKRVFMMMILKMMKMMMMNKKKMMIAWFLQWFYNGVAISADASHSITGNGLKILNVQVYNIGRYECKAQNIAGSASAHTTLYVQGEQITRNSLSLFTDFDLESALFVLLTWFFSWVGAMLGIWFVSNLMIILLIVY